MSDFYKRTLRSILDSVILEALQEKPDHGYSLIKIVRKRHGVLMGPSTVYPLLNDLEKKGLVTAKWKFSNSKPQKQYNITFQGKRALEQMHLDIEILVDSLQIERSSL